MKRSRIIVRLAAGVVLVYLLACMIAALVSRHFLFPAPARADVAFSDATTIEQKTSDGTTARGLSFGTGDTTIVYFHGNGELAEDNVGFARELASHGYTVMLAEYRGYGISRDAGAPSERGIYADAEALITSLGPRRERLVLMGFSLGTGVAVEMAARKHGRALVLLAPYTSIPDVAARWIPLLPMRLLMRDKLDSRSKAASIDLPVFVAHGAEDEVVPFDMGETLAHTFPHGHFNAVSGAHHMDLFSRDDRLMQKLVDFLIQAMPL
jgi:pimeloyl-ACP methyl ester carboxylesterase